MLVAWTRDVQVSAADVVHRLVVDEERTVGVLDGAVGGENGVVWFYNSCRDTRGWVDGELKLGFLTVVGRKTLLQERAKARAGTPTEGVEDQESLQRRAVVWSWH